jgi:purine-binding chemotaxis protein CheW
MTDYVTFTTAGQLFGLPIEHVQDVFPLADVTRVPLAGREIAGVLNLRGRIVTVIDLAHRLELEAPRDTSAQMVIGIERRAESFGILVDRLGEVLSLADRDREPAPINLDYAGRCSNRGIPARREDSCRARCRSHAGFRQFALERHAVKRQMQKVLFQAVRALTQ